MSYSVLIVDDSNFFQMRLKEVINEHQDLKVVGIASNGQEAIDLTAKLKPDVISMDYEMPFLDGVSAVKVIMAENPTPIIMFSSMTYEGARITLDALEAGAVDFMNKNFAEVSSNSAVFKKKFHDRLITFASGSNKKAPPPEPASPAPASALTQPKTSSTGSSASTSASRTTQSSYKSMSSLQSSPSTPAPAAPSPATPSRSSKKLKGKVKLVAIGASTGGPVALADIITALPANFPAPIVVIQHMPENFTRAFSERLNKQARLRVKEAEHGDRIERGVVLVAPGGKQMMIDRSGNTVKIIDGDDRVNYKPCVDITFASAAATYGDSVLGIVLTGMGSDGCEGARLLTGKGSTIWSQDQASCVVYGMPAAVANHKLTSCVLPLKDFAKKMISDV